LLKDQSIQTFAQISKKNVSVILYIFLPFMKTIALPAQFHYTYALNFYNTFLIIFGFAFISLDFVSESGLYYHHYKLKAMYVP